MAQYFSSCWRHVRRCLLLLLLAIGLTVAAVAAVPRVVVGHVRVQFLSPSLVRLEQQGPKGFEDRPTFLVVQRAWPGTAFTRTDSTTEVILTTAHYVVHLPAAGTSLTGTRVLAPNGTVLYTVADPLPARPVFPAPEDLHGAFAVADSPRVMPPAWGATPPPADQLEKLGDLRATSGWELNNDAPDLYVFLDTRGYIPLRKEFLRLTGPVPMLPRFVLGFANSRWYPYTEQTALADIDRYRSAGIPLDTQVIDTDWRVGGSGGYEVNTRDFPDIARFFQQAHDRHVKIMFNDHPIPISAPLDTQHLQYRWDGLTGLLKQGLDVWWFDRNWSETLAGPLPGLETEIWGQRVYTDNMARLRPSERPLLMSMRSGHPASHRYPYNWTGDISSSWDALRWGITDSVDDGIDLLWVSQDLGGFGGNPSDELYTRFVQWGTLSPAARLHCTLGAVRYPWAHGAQVQGIITDYVKMRYRLNPTLYAATRRVHDDGTPLLRRCDLEWPDAAAARGSLQYLLADDLLVAPVYSGDPTVSAALAPGELPGERVIPTEMLRTMNGKPGLLGAYFHGTEPTGDPAATRIDPTINFNWSDTVPHDGFAHDNYAVRWTGVLGPAPASGSYTLVTYSDDGVRVRLDGKLLIDNWTPHGETHDAVTVSLAAGQSYNLTVEYNQLGGAAICRLCWVVPGAHAAVKPPIPDTRRTLWVPPGVWENAWTGERVSGPRTITVTVPLRQEPLYIRQGSIITLAPDMQYLTEKPWSPLTLDAYPPAAGRVTREVYEDDGHSTGYLHNQCARIPLTLTRDGHVIRLTVAAAQGHFPGQLTERAWVVRVHLAPGETARGVSVGKRRLPIGAATPANTQRAYAVLLAPSKDAALSIPFLGAGAAPAPQAGPVLDIHLPTAPVTARQAVEVIIK